MPPDATHERELIVRTPNTPRKVHPVVFVHGAWQGAWCWEEHFLDYFVGQGYQVYALSFRHHGASPGPKSLRRSRIADYVRDLAALTETLAVQPILVAHSMGGLVVQKYLETAATPAAVLLASVPPQGALRAALRTARRIPWQFLKANLHRRLYPLVETPHLARAMLFSPTMTDDALLRYFRLIQDESYLAFLDMVLLNRPHPQRVKTPMLVLGGERDAIFRPAEVHATATAYRTEAVLFPGMAHDMMLEPGWRMVAETIVEWLDTQGL